MIRTLIAAATLLAATPVVAQERPAAAAGPRRAVPASTPARTILFVGNSFTQGAHSAVRNWHADRVTDLNGAGYGGVPALFKQFTEEAGLDYAVSLETQGGKTLGFHYDERRALIDRPWDVVVLQELSTLSRERPGDDTDYRRDVGRFATLLRARNPAVQVQLMATWTRADETYRPKGHWYGKPVGAMALDLRAAADRARTATPGIAGVLPVGQAWTRAIAKGVADANPYDGIGAGQVDLWTYDQYHGSIFGYYLEALVVFGQVTGVDPRTLGRDERAADALGIAPDVAVALQNVAQEELAANGGR